MAPGQIGRFQLRLIVCHVGGVIAEFITMPHLLAGGLEMQNVVLAWVAGVVLFLAFAIVGGVVWRRSIMARPFRWAIFSPAGVALAIYLLLGSLGGFESGDARIAMETSLVGGICALLSSAFFLLWTWAAPIGRSSER